MTIRPKRIENGQSIEVDTIYKLSDSKGWELAGNMRQARQGTLTCVRPVVSPDDQIWANFPFEDVLSKTGAPYNLSE